jgi:hypothetical protein
MGPIIVCGMSFPISSGVLFQTFSVGCSIDAPQALAALQVGEQLLKNGHEYHTLARRIMDCCFKDIDASRGLSTKSCLVDPYPIVPLYLFSVASQAYQM